MPKHILYRKPYAKNTDALKKIWYSRMHEGLFKNHAGPTFAVNQIQQRTDTEHSIDPEIIYLNKRGRRL